MIDKIKELCIRYKSFLMYAIFGVLTTLVNILSYWIFAHPMGMLDSFGSKLPNALAWIVSCTFAYLTNRKWVFESEAKALDAILREVVYFFACRLATLALETLIMHVFVDELEFNDLIIKVCANVVVIIANYVFSKLVIFKKDRKTGYNRIKE